MACYELEPGSKRHYGTVLSFKPPLPVDQPDISHIRRTAKTLALDAPVAYAWERVPGWLAETQEVFPRVKGPILTLDGGSSTPFYTQKLRAAEFGRAGERAREIERNFFDTQLSEELQDISLALEIERDRLSGESTRLFEDLAHDGPTGLSLVHRALARQHDIRALLAAGIQKILYELNIEEASATSAEGQAWLAESIFQTLASQRATYVIEPERSDMETRWGLRNNSQLADSDYLTSLGLLNIPTIEALNARKLLAEDPNNQAARLAARETEPVGPELASHYLHWQSRYLAGHIAGNHRFRPARFLSMDARDPDDIAQSAIANTPSSTRGMNIFPHAIASLYDDRHHMVGNILEPLPVPDNSLALMTFFDSWPHNFGIDPSTELGAVIDSAVSFEERLETEPGFFEERVETAAAQLMDWYGKLAYGGKIVIFPWSIAGGNLNTKGLLEAIELRFSQLSQRGIQKMTLHREVLEQWMSESDKQISVVNSGIFRDAGERFEILMINKPRESSLRVQKRLKIGRAVTNAAQTQG